MKGLKLTLIILGSLAALVALVGVLAFTSGVQTWAVRRTLAGQARFKADAGRVSAGLSAAELRDVRFEQDGLVITAKEVTAAYSATDYLSGHRVNIARVTVRGLEVDARKFTARGQPAEASAKAALAPFAGLLNALRLPGEVRLGELALDAKILLPGEQTVMLTLDGGGIAPGQFGTIKWKATLADAAKGAAISSAQTTGEIKVRTTSDLRIDAIEVAGDAQVTGPSLPADPVRIELKLAQAAPNAGETITANISLVRGAAPEQLVKVDVAYAAGKPVLTGTWHLAVRSEQFATVLEKLGLPEVALSGDGSFSYNIESGAASAAGAIEGTAAKFEKLGPDLAAIGALKLHAAFDGGSSKDAAQLNKLDFDVATADGRKLVTVAAEQKLSFAFKDQKITAERPGAELARVTLLGVPLAWAQPVLKPRTIAGDLSGVLVVGAELDGSRVKLSTVEPITLRGVTLREGDKLLADRVTIALSPKVDYTEKRIVAEVEKLSISTPEGDTVSGTLSADLTRGAKPATAFSADLQGKLAALLKPYLPAGVGPLTLAVSTKGRLEGQSLQLAALKVQVDREGGAVLAGVETLQPIAVALDTQKVSAPNAATPVARVRWAEIPLAWAEPYVAQSKLAGQLAAGSIEATLPGGDAVMIRVLDRLAARGATIVLNGQELLRGADFATDLVATWRTGTLTAEIKRLELRQGNASLLSAAVAGEATPGKILRASGHGSIEADFAALAKQPALAAQLPLLRGTVAAKFDATVADGVTAKFTIAAQNLVAREGALPLGGMTLDVEAKLDAQNAGTARTALVVTKDGRKSDLTLDGKVGLKPGAVSFEGRLTSEQLVVDDLQALSALSTPPPPTAAEVAKSTPAPRPAPVAAARPAAQAAGPVKDMTPVWAGFAGRFDLNLKAIKQGANTLGDLTGAITARPDRLAIENVSLRLNGNPVKVNTLLSFDAKLARPYTLAGSLDIPGFNVGEFLKKADPSTPPAIETTVTVVSKFSGTAANLPEFADRVMGQFEFKGSKGVLRALNKKAETTSAVSGLLGIAAGLAGQQRLAEGLAGASELAQLLKDIPFDSATVQVERGADAAIVVKSIELLSPMMHLTGNGRIDHKPGAPFDTAPLSLQLQLAAKDRLATGLNQARQLTGNKDAQGYYLMATPFSLGGTLSKPDSSEFWRKFTLNTAGGFLR
jgi:hypothetical protein